MMVSLASQCLWNVNILTAILIFEAEERILLLEIRIILYSNLLAIL